MPTATRTFRTAALLILSLATINAPAIPRAFPVKAGGPSVQFGTGRIRATGATPGARIHFTGVSLSDAGGVLRVTKAAGAATADDKGNAELATDVHTRSVWLVIDASKGYTVAAPHGMLLREMDLPGNADANASGQVAQLQLSRFHVEVFLIRPGEGTWTAYFRDGGPRDADREPNGSNHASLADLQPIGGTTRGADRIERDDYLFLVDRNSLEFHVLRRGHE